ncbi:EamA family transporter [Bacillus canaveralius]|uniref:EamA family transporter n=1 Tax=Bacillus canaveralius TaxID=1403243 RepID=A0A2N5GJ65_9BACI|nr:DMT family transporter [Bacillus canaveralius]PLR81096.1 EamA family transporter [Bacillus canaveralius]PLR99036.1 EamA family transporter [Bacillus canaveralius]
MKKQLFADFSLLLIAFVWGSTFVLVQNAIAFLDPFSFNGIRFFLAAILLGGWLFLFERKQLRHLNKKIVMSGLFLGFLLFIGYAFQTAGLLYTTSSKAGFITGLSVVMVPIFAIYLLNERPGRNAVIGIIGATAGLYLLTMAGTSGLTTGDGLVFVCAIGFAMHILMTGKYAGQFPALLLTMIQVSTVALLSAISAFLFEDWQSVAKHDILLSRDVAAALLITAVFATALAFLAQTSFQKFTTPTRVALIFAMEPVFAAVTAYVWAGERLSFSAVLGCMLIFAGMVFAELPRKPAASLLKQKHELVHEATSNHVKQK